MSKTLKTFYGVPEARLGAYIFGFILSVGLTLLAYEAAASQVIASWQIYTIIITLAIIQLVVQLVFFLHLGKESKPRWNLLIFFFMIIVIFILVGGSLWIMYNLDYMNGSNSNDDTTIIKEEGIHH